MKRPGARVRIALVTWSCGLLHLPDWVVSHTSLTAADAGGTRCAALHRQSFAAEVPAPFTACRIAAKTSRAATARAGGWVLTDLGTLGGSFSTAYGINASGHIAGQARTRTGLLHPFTYRGGVRTDLEGPSAASGGARAINEAGHVAGTWEAASGTAHAVMYHRGRRIDLGTLGGPGSQALDINRWGQVVGQADAVDGPRAFLFQNGKMAELALPSHVGLSSANSINNAGQIVGWWSPRTETPEIDHPSRYAFLYTHGQMRNLGTLGGSFSDAYGINAAGWVAGEAATDRGVAHAFLYRGVRMRDLGTLGGASSCARAINGSGQIVGHSLTRAGVSHAFLYEREKMTDLNRLIPRSLGWVLVAAYDINDGGQIVGAGIWRGRRRAFLLSPPGAVARSRRGPGGASGKPARRIPRRE